MSRIEEKAQSMTQETQWLFDLPWERLEQLRPTDVWLRSATLWQSLDGQWGRALQLSAEAAPSEHWQPLRPLQILAGASALERAGYHYAVEADALPEHWPELDAWYTHEHLPGLAAVPGAIQARRYQRLAGSGPRHIACYELTDPAVLQSEPWLAVRHTDWSSRVRPTFVNPRRTMFRRVELP